MIEQVTEGGVTYKVETNSHGTKCWLLNGKLHRVNGPAIEGANGDKWWYLNGKRHRVNGPAIEWDNGTKEWYLTNKKLTEEEFKDFRKQVEYINKHPEDAPLYLNHKHLNFIAKEILDGTDREIVRELRC